MKKVAKKPRIGRPPKLDRGEVRDKRLDDVRFSAKELAVCKSLAEKDGVAWSAWVRLRLGLQ